MNDVLLLIGLLVCHYLADFCLTLPVMIQAKADGRRLWPIMMQSDMGTGSCYITIVKQ